MTDLKVFQVETTYGFKLTEEQRTILFNGLRSSTRTETKDAWMRDHRMFNIKDEDGTNWLQYRVSKEEDTPETHEMVQQWFAKALIRSRPGHVRWQRIGEDIDVFTEEKVARASAERDGVPKCISEAFIRHWPGYPMEYTLRDNGNWTAKFLFDGEPKDFSIGPSTEAASGWMLLSMSDVVPDEVWDGIQEDLF